MSKSRPGQIQITVGGKCGQTATAAMAVAGMIQSVDVPRYILIHGRLAHDSQEVKTNKSKQIHKQTNHASEMYRPSGDVCESVCLSFALPEVYM